MCMKAQPSEAAVFHKRFHVRQKAISMVRSYKTSFSLKEECGEIHKLTAFSKIILDSLDSNDSIYLYHKGDDIETKD